MLIFIDICVAAVYFFGSGTDPISLLVLLVLVGGPSSKMSKAPLFQIGSG